MRLFALSLCVWAGLAQAETRFAVQDQAIPPADKMVVTDKGTPSFIVTKAGKRPRKTRADLEREAGEVSSRKGAKVNFTEAIRDLKRR